MKKAIISDQISMDFEEALFRVKDRFEYIEIHSLWNKTVEELDDTEIHEVEKLLKKYRMHVSCLSTTLFLMCPLYTDVDYLEKFSDKFLVFIGDIDDHVECLQKCIEMGERLNTEYIRIFPFRLEEKATKDFNVYLRDMAEKLQTAVGIAEKGKKCLIIENCPHSYMPRGNMTFELARQINSDRVMLLYDIGNSFRSQNDQYPEEFKKDSLLDEYNKIKEKVTYFHFKDYMKNNNGFQHAAFGEGDVGFTNLYEVIKMDDNDKVISLEPEVDAEGVEISIQNMLAL